MKIILSCFLLLLFTCSQPASNNATTTPETTTTQTKEQLLSLERKWLEAEFALDTAYLFTLLDSTFIGVSVDHISNKQQEIAGIYNNISGMPKESIFLDSLKLENAIVNVYGNTAVVILIIHTYKKDKGNPVEKWTRFYDVWINRNETWKAVSSQGTTIKEKN
ncbi:MAG: nuclear transport factor 2 family protein [Panacibacter sp.]